MHSRSITTSCIEVEKKFLPSARLRRLLDLAETPKAICQPRPSPSTSTIRKLEALQPNQKRNLDFRRLPDKLIRDTYFDLNDQLSKQGIWIRHRTSCTAQNAIAHHVALKQAPTVWEAKVRLAGDFHDSQFHEIEGETAVRSLVRKHFSSAAFEDLDCMADLKTYRKCWIVDNLCLPGQEGKRNDSLSTSRQLCIALDEVTETHSSATDRYNAFHHVVGEVEMTDEIVGGRNEHDAKYEAGRRMDSLLQLFMLENAELFSTSPKPQGKLSAFFAWKKATAERERDGERPSEAA